jgi:hypothetical protein
VTESFKEIAEFINEYIDGCSFVGISSDNEVFIRFDRESPDRESAAGMAIQTRFPHVEKVIVVIQPSIGQVKQMVDDLNNVLEDSPAKKDLLDIGSF